MSDDSYVRSIPLTSRDIHRFTANARFNGDNMKTVGRYVLLTEFLNILSLSGVFGEVGTSTVRCLRGRTKEKNGRRRRQPLATHTQKETHTELFSEEEKSAALPWSYSCFSLASSATTRFQIFKYRW